MKPARSNSFRLHRVSRANSVRLQSQTFYQPDDMLKASAMNSVAKGIKHNQLGFLTGYNLNKLRKQQTETTDNFYQFAHVTLADTRKRYDQVKKKKEGVDQNITRLREELAKYTGIVEEYSDRISSGKDHVTEKQKELQDKAVLLEEAFMQKNILINMKNRLKADKVVYDQRKYNLGKEHSFQSKQLQVFKKDGLYVGEEKGRAEKVYAKFLEQLDNEKAERDEHIKNLQAMIEQKQRCAQANTIREIQIQEIAQRASQNKDPTEVEWYRIYLTHVFVNKMLRNKIDREMNKFSTVEFAFKNIKTATGVNDAKTFISKFLNKQSEYGELLGMIAVNEKKIGELKETRDYLLQELNGLELEKQTLQNVKHKNVELSAQMKEFHNVSDHERKMETYLHKISVWLSRQAKKFNSIQKGAEIQFKESRHKEQVKSNFIEFCHILSKLMGKSDKVDVEELTEVSDLSARDSARVARVVAKKSRKNSLGEQIYDLEEEDLAPSNQNEEKDMVAAQREEIIRSNEKFMREARRRMEERRRLLSDKHADKKDKKQAEAKREDDD